MYKIKLWYFLSFGILFQFEIKNINIEKGKTNLCTYDGFAVTGIKVLSVQDHRKYHLRWSCTEQQRPLGKDQIGEKCTCDIN